MEISDKTGTVAIVGAGWYGSHVACVLSKLGYQVTLFEKNTDIFSGTSGTFGVRLHLGPHYPRSSATRKGCHTGFVEFCKKYPQLINWHEYSIYGLGTLDANNEPSKIGLDQFKTVCKESNTYREIDLKKSGYQNLLFAVTVEEPSIVVGERLRKIFKSLLKKAGVKVICGITITSLESSTDNIRINTDLEASYTFDYVINATGYQYLLPKEPPPFKMEIIYQPCLALVYQDTKQPPPNLPFSFIVMDGWFPCIMPYDDSITNHGSKILKYILTHGKWTIVGSYQTAEEASIRLASIDEKFVTQYVKPPCESEIIKFWPEFKKRFKYLTWVGAVLAKIKTDREFRSAVTFKDLLSGVVYVIPGKVSNIFDSEKEVINLINNQNTLIDKNYQYIKGGVLDDSTSEITEKPKDPNRNTCELQPYQKIYENNVKILKNFNKLHLIILSLSIIFLIYLFNTQTDKKITASISTILLIMVTVLLFNYFNVVPIKYLKTSANSGLTSIKHKMFPLPRTRSQDYHEGTALLKNNTKKS